MRLTQAVLEVLAKNLSLGELEKLRATFPPHLREIWIAIYAEIVDLLPPEIRERIVEHVESDLVKTPVAKLADHFRSLQPI